MFNQLLQLDLRNLSSESKKNDPELKDSIERAILKVRFSQLDTNDKQIKVISQSPEVLKPMLLACERRSPKLTAIAIGGIHRLIVHQAIHKNWVSKIIKVLGLALDSIEDQATQIKILQCAVGLLTNKTVTIHDEELAQCLLIQFKLHKLPGIQSVASASLLQAIGNMFDNLRIIRNNTEEDNETEKDRATEISLFIIDAIRLLRDLCSIAMEESPTWLIIDGISRNFAFELLESLLSNYHTLFHETPQLSEILKDKICPILVQVFRTKKQFPLMLRLLRIIIVFVHHYPEIIIGQAEKLLTRVIVLLEGDNPLWLKCLVLEVIRNITTEEELLLTLYDTTMDNTAKSQKRRPSEPSLSSLASSSEQYHSEPKISLLQVLSDLSSSDWEETSHDISSNKVRTESRNARKNRKPKIGENIRMLDKIINSLRRFLQSILRETETNEHHHHQLDPPTPAKIQSMEFLSFTEPPDIPIAYIVNVGVQCVIGIIDAIQTLSTNFREKKISENQYILCKKMTESSWPAILASLSIALTNATDEGLMQGILKGYQTFTQTCGDLSLITPRDAFLTSLKKYAVPSNFTRKQSNPRTCNISTLRVTLKNLHTMKRVINIAHQIGNSLGESWDIVLDTLEFLHILLNSWPGVIVTEKDEEEKEQLGKDEIYVLSSSFSTLFSTSQFLSDEGLIQLLEHLDRRARTTLFPPLVEEMEFLEQATEAYIKAYGLFGVIKIVELIEANMHRIHVVWDLVNDFINLVCNHGNRHVRSEGVIALSKIAESGLKMDNPQLQWSILCTMKTLASSQYSDVREMTLDQIYNILQSCGHRLSTGWPFVLTIISLTINSNGKFEPRPKHIVKSFNSLRYICTDFLGELPIDCLEQLIVTVGIYGKPAGDINVAITSISGLLWTASDFIANEVTKNPNITEEKLSNLWITLFGQLRAVSLYERHEIRTAALRAMFGILIAHGNVLRPHDWEQTLEILYAMLDGISVLAGEASTEENLLEHQLGQEEDGKPAMMLVHHSRNSAAKQWTETRVIALEGVLRIFQTFFATLSRDLSDVTKCWKKLMSYIALYWDSSDIEVALAGVKAVESMLIAGSGVDVYPAELWEQGWKTYLSMVLTLTTKEQKVSSTTLNIFSNSVNNLYSKLKHKMSDRDINLYLSVVKPLPLFPVQFAGELSPLRRTVISIFQELAVQSPSSIPKIVSILLWYIGKAIGFPYKSKCYIDPEEKSNSSDREILSWNISENKINKFCVPLAELSIKGLKMLWSMTENSASRISIFGDLMQVLGRVIQLKFVNYQSSLWLEALNLIIIVMEEGAMQVNHSVMSNIDLNVIWTDITDSIESFLLHHPNMEQNYDPGDLERDEALDVSLCKTLIYLLKQPAIVPLLRERLINILFECTKEGRQQISETSYKILFNLISQPQQQKDPKKGSNINMETSINEVAKIVGPRLLSTCKSVLLSFIKDEQSQKLDRQRVIEVCFLLEQLEILQITEVVKLKKKGPRAHLLELFLVLCDCITTNETNVKSTLHRLFYQIAKELNLMDVK